MVITDTAPLAASRVDLAGARIELSGGPDIYLVDDAGTNRHIPDPTTCNNLFRAWSGMQAVDIATINGTRTSPAAPIWQHRQVVAPSTW